MMKNPTPQRIALLASVWITIAFSAVYGIMVFLSQTSTYWWTFGLLVLAVFVASYFILIDYLKKYIYRKVKLIYKTIHREKLAPEDKKKSVDAKANIIDEVEREVSEWAETQRKEIARYKTWEEYRRNYIGDISHELKTPIFNIQGYLETLLNGGLEDSNINQKFLDRAANNVERLKTIVNDLESISRLESGQMILELTSFDIKELTKEVFEDMEMKAKQRKVTLEFKDGAAQGYKVKADRDRIRQVLNNLVDNSLKYGVEGGRTKVAFYDMDKNILIEVADNGLGIAKQHLPHVFDRFYRVDKSRSRSQGGSGLGLSIVKHITEAHAQTINVRSTPNLGSTFGFTLEKAG